MAAAPSPVHRRRSWWSTWLGYLLAGALGGIAVALAFTTGNGGRGLRGSGAPVDQQRVVPAFRSIDLAGSSIVTVHVGRPQSVTVRTDRNLLSRVTTRVRTGRLVIETRGSFSTRTRMRVLVTVPSLDAITLTGSGVVEVEGMRARSLTVTLAGSGVLHVSGTTSRLDVALDGSGYAALGSLVARTARAVVDGAGRIDLTATRALDASVPGTGAIVYGGDPAHVTTRITGTGAITRAAPGEAVAG